MAKQWYVMLDSERIGPISSGALVKMAESGTVLRDTLVWSEGLDNWISADSVEGLFHDAELQDQSVDESNPLGFLDQQQGERRASAWPRNTGPVRCPHCGSDQITAQKKGFSVGNAAVGLVLIGPLGLVGGAIGSGKVLITCLHCGYRWRPG